MLSDAIKPLAPMTRQLGGRVLRSLKAIPEIAFSQNLPNSSDKEVI